MGIMFAERLRVNTPTTGTGTLSLGSAVASFRSFGQAVLDRQLVSGCTVYYAIDDGIAWETGTGIFIGNEQIVALTGPVAGNVLASQIASQPAEMIGTTDSLTRSLSQSSTGALLSLSGSALVSLTLTAAFGNVIVNAAPSINPTFTGPVTVIGGITLIDGSTTPMLLSFVTGGSASPSFTTRSFGTTLVLWNSLGASSSDYAMGVSTNAQWHSVPSSLSQFVWYADTTQIAILTGTGLWTFNGGIDQTNIGNTTPAAGTFTSLNVPTPATGTSSKAVATTAFVAPAVNNTGRNRIQNAGFAMALRGTSFTNLTTKYTCDRWIGYSTVNTATVTQIAATGYGPSSYGCSVTLPLSGTQQLAEVIQRVAANEATDLSGQIMTLSLYGSVVFGGTTTGYCTIGIETPSIVNNWTTSVITDNVYLTIPMYPTAARTQVSFTMPTVSNGFQLLLRVTGTSGTGTITYTLSSVQLELGGMATAFESKSILEDNLDCEYYCQQVSPSASAYIAIANGYNATQINFPVMRITPTITLLTAGSTSPNLATVVLTPSSTSAAYYQVLSSAAGNTYSLAATYLLSADL